MLIHPHRINNKGGAGIANPPGLGGEGFPRKWMKEPDDMWEEVVVDGVVKRLRKGYTTGACATAATKGALLSLIRQEPVRDVSIMLPIQRMARFTIDQLRFTTEEASCSVVKDGGDDPDATHGAHIHSTVRWSSRPGIHLDGGYGVGRVTKPGLGLAVGEPAINRVPRKMLMETVRGVLKDHWPAPGISVEISVPEGPEIAPKTLNPRLGIVGGISILGTTGIVRPYSLSSWRASVVMAINVSASCGSDAVILTTGGRSESYAMQHWPELPDEAFVDIGGFLGNALYAVSLKPAIRRIGLVAMIGKLSKVAGGALNLHAYDSTVSFELLAKIAQESGLKHELVDKIRWANTARHVGELVVAAKAYRFFDRLAAKAGDTLLAKLPHHGVTVLLVGPDGQLWGKYDSDLILGN